MGSIDRGILGKSGCVKSLLPKTNNIRKHLIEEQVDFKNLPPPQKKKLTTFWKYFFSCFMKNEISFREYPFQIPKKKTNRLQKHKYRSNETRQSILK